MKLFEDWNGDQGINTTFHDVDGRVTIQKTYDAEPFLKVAAEHRALTEGQRWGEGRFVGTIPPAELATMMRRDGTIRPEAVTAWLKANPAMVAFSKFLK